MTVGPDTKPTTPAETAELYRWITRQQRDDHRVAEQFLDGVIRFAHQDHMHIDLEATPEFRLHLVKVLTERVFAA